MTTPILPPNHHAEHHVSGGLIDWFAAVTMLVGRRRDARGLCGLVLNGSEDHLVDIGCGPGVAVREAARHVPKVTGVDPSAPMLRVARLVTPQRLWNRGRIEWKEAGAEDLPFPDDSVSVCWSIASVHHWPDLESGVREAARVLVPGGRLFAAEKRSRPGSTGHASHGWTQDQAIAFADLLTESGFVDVGITNHDVGRRRAVVVEGRVR